MGSPIIKDNSHVKRKLHLEHHIGDDDFSVPHLEIWSRILSLEHSKPLDFLSHFALIHRLNLLAQVSKATGSLADQIGLKDSGTHSSCANVSFNDFAHIPWEDSTNFPKPPKRKNSFINCWWNIRGTFQGYVGEILVVFLLKKAHLPHFHCVFYIFFWKKCLPFWFNSEKGRFCFHVIHNSYCFCWFMLRSICMNLECCT